MIILLKIVKLIQYMKQFLQNEKIDPYKRWGYNIYRCKNLFLFTP